MRLGHFDLNLLVALDALLETRSVTRASERLHIGPSATSSALGRLREHFNDELLQQIGRRMELTPLAQSLSEPVREILVRTQATLQAKAGFDPQTEVRQFVFNASDYVTTVFMSQFAPALHKLAPGITLEVYSMAEKVQDKVDRGELDIAIFPDRFASTDHPSEVLFEESYSCVVWTGNTKVKDAISFEDYMSLGHVSASFGENRLAGFEEWFLQNFGFRRKVELTVNHFNALAQMVVGTPWAATVQTRLAQWYAGFLPIKVLPLPINIPPLKMVMQWHRFQNHDPAHSWMRDQIRQAAQRLPPIPATEQR
jgi:LysR family nod box-dependent transcriptional activator